MNSQQKTEIIAFFSIHNFFRLKTEKSQIEKFDSLLNEFYAEFGKGWIYADILKMLQEYQADKQKAKQKREREKLIKANSLPISSSLDSSNGHVRILPAGKYVLTSAQNNTDIDKSFFESLMIYCKENNASLLVGKLTYNKNGFLQPEQQEQDLWYDPAIKPFLAQGQISLDDKFHFIADANVLPTCKNPLTGFAGITKAGIHVVIPASKISLKVSAALKNAPVKILASTGSVTKRNYILRKAGAVAAIEHNIGAVYINTETNEIRHLEQMEGFTGFYDLREKYTPNGSECQNSVSCLQFGDLHAEKLEQKNLDSALKLIDQLSPENLIIEDCLDFSSRNHHNIKNSIFIHEQHVNKNTVKGDIKAATKALDIFASALPDDSQIHVIESNHDLALVTWLRNADFKDDPINAVVYLDCMLKLYKHIEKTGKSDLNMLEYAYKYIGKGKYKHKIDFNNTDDSLIIAHTEHGCHGHTGVNGSPGSLLQFRGLGIAMNTGHTHSPSITGKVYTAGVLASLEMTYNIGASSWAIAHIVTYENGQRQILFT